MITCRLPPASLPEKYGRASARMARTSISNWRRSSQLWRSRWKGALACVSARNFCQSNVLETRRTTRLRLSR
jgi:hypothetical protein